ncbi:MAG: HAD-IA family hydrolase, partial [Candidatus Omnitrophica bacterium]|nr:HAD-IA family hydrolase [Candidatus Omnitrophota bacterium]
GLRIQPMDYYRWEGLSVYEVPEKLFGAYGKQTPSDPKALVQKKEAYYKQNHTFSFYPGALDMLDGLARNGIKTAVVTAALYERLKHTVSAEILNKFDAVVTGEDTRLGKPSPEPYLKALMKLQLAPEECLAVENAPLGIESAKKAGLYCAAVCSTLDRSYLGSADAIFDSLEHFKKSLVQPMLS